MKGLVQKEEKGQERKVVRTAIAIGDTIDVVVVSSLEVRSEFEDREGEGEDKSIKEWT